MRNLIYAINTTLDGCCDHTKFYPDEETMAYFTHPHLSKYLTWTCNNLSGTLERAQQLKNCPSNFLSIKN
jgi:hypothetical protein